MNVNTLDEQIEVLIAYRDGNTLQYLDKDGYKDKTTECIPTFNTDYYRVKPTRREVWVNFYGDGDHRNYAHSGEDEALRYASESQIEVKTVKFIEEM